MPNHTFHEPGDGHDCKEFGCPYCELAVCKTCSLFEGALTTDCPGEKASGEKSDEIYAGKLDYIDGEGWVEKLNPTNLTWLYGSYVRFYGTDQEFIDLHSIKMDFHEIIKRWKEWGYSLEKLKRRNNHA